MTPSFMGQAVLGSANALTVNNGGNTLNVSGVLTGTTSAAVTAAQTALLALASTNGGGAGPLIVPTGYSAVPGSNIAQLTAEAAPGATSLSVTSTAGLGAGSIISLESAARPGLFERATVTATPTNNTTLAVSALVNPYLVGDIVATGPLGVASLDPQGPATPLPGGVNYPGWDTWQATFPSSGVNFGSTTGSGSAYQCTYTVAFVVVRGPNT